MINLFDIIPRNYPRKMEKTTNFALVNEKHHSAWVKTSDTPVARTLNLHAFMIDNAVMMIFS